MAEYADSGAAQNKKRNLRDTFARAALIALLPLALESGAMASDGLFLHREQVPSRDIFFSDYFLFSAQADVFQMTDTERSALQLALDVCHRALSAEDARRLRCQMALLQRSMDYGTGRQLDRLLDAVQFMTFMVRYNHTIGRQNEVGLGSRLGSIDHGLRDAIRIASQATE